ncbi:MAG: Glu/Leu/Phe/Val dehydrogenase, partial [Phycisphaeraceae bacterium]
PDVGTNAQIMAWMADTYMNLNEPHRRFDGMAVVTGKPPEFGGSAGREKATGQGLVYVLEEMLPEMGYESFSDLSFTLAGYGNVGSWAGRLMADRGAKMLAVLDHTGAVHHPDGIDAAALSEYVQEHGGVAGYPTAEAITPEQFYETQTDLFIPAALEQMITADVAERLNCRYVVEGANAPTTPAGERILQQAGVTILPAILCNAGGVTVSYFEWRQNRQAETWTAEEVDEQLRRQMIFASRRVKLAAVRLDCDLGTAAYAAALEHLAKVYNIRGIFP